MIVISNPIRPKEGRPYISFVALFAFVLWITIFFFLDLIALLEQGYLLPILAAMLIFLLIQVVSLLVNQRILLFRVVVVAFTCGILLSTLYMCLYCYKTSLCKTVSPNNLTYEITSDVSQNDYGYYVEATTHINDVPIQVRLNLSNINSDVINTVTLGSVLTLQGTFSAPSDSSGNYYFHNNLAGSVKIYSVEIKENSSLLNGIYLARNRATTVLDGITAEDERSFLKALLLGNRTELFSGSFYQSVKVCGLAHLVAVSGAHLVIILSLCSLLLRKLRLSRRIQIVIICLLILTYLLFTGFALSCLRAVAMSLISLLALFSKRRNHSLNALSLMVVVFVILEPSAVYSLSFELSILATLGIIVFMPLFNCWYEQAFSFIPKTLYDSVGITFCALLMTFAITASEFSQFSLVCVFTNYVASLYIPFVMAIGLVLSIVNPLFQSELLISLLYWISFLLCEGIRVVASLPFAAIPISINCIEELIFSFVAPIFLYLLWPQVSIKGFLILGITFIVAVLFAGSSWIYQQGITRIVMLDVGQGDAILLQSEGKNILIDTGNQDSKLLYGLAQNNAFHLDAVIITHPDDDHCGSLDSLIGFVDCSHVYIADGLDELDDSKVEKLCQSASTLSNQGTYEELKFHDEIYEGAFTARVVSPQTISHDGENEDSLCLYVQSDIDHNKEFEHEALLVGDAESEVLESFISRESIYDIDVLKVGHHGSKISLNENVIEELKPKVALISVGENNRYGHPRQETLDFLSLVNAKVFRTDLDGAVVCNFFLDSVTFQTLG